MRLGILQLSDIHIRSGRQNHILDKAYLISSALRVATTDIDVITVVMSGDLAFAGSPDEYNLGGSFLTDVRSRIEAAYNNVPVHLILIPGNHDCDFNRDDQMRQLTLDAFGQSRRPSIEDLTATHCTRIQDAFFNLADSLSNADTIRPVNRLYHEVHIPFGQFTVVFACYNTAWCSRLNEQPSGMSFPIDLVRPVDPPSQPILRVSVLHHPTNWMNPDNRRLLREQIETTSHIVLTGHEHLPQRSKYSSSTGASNLHFEGGVLQEVGDDATSSFNLFLFDGATDQYKTFSFHLDGDRYTIRPDTTGWLQIDRGSLLPKHRYAMQSDFEEKLLNPGAAFTHPRKSQLTLRDLFVFPDLQAMTVSSSSGHKPSTFIDGPDVVETLRSKMKVVISGDQHCGKSSLAYIYFIEEYESGKVPILLDGSQVAETSPDGFFEHLDACFHQQYIADEHTRVASLPVDDLVIVIDNFHRIKKSVSAKARFAGWLSTQFSQVIILADDAFHIESITATSDNQNPYFEYTHYVVPELGFARRDALIQKWYGLGDSDTTDPEIITAQAVRSGTMIDSLLGENLLPAHPIVVLTFLQVIESQTQANASIGSYGQCYELLIRNALIRISEGIDDLTTLQNYLAELAIHMFQEERRWMSEVTLRAFHESYCERYDITVPFERYILNLRKAHILRNEHDRTAFAYDYFYYYFIARYLSEHISEARVRGIVEQITTNLHSTENANILLFLTHLSKDPLIIKSVLTRAEAFYSDVEPARLKDDVAFIASLVTQIPQLVVNDSDPEERRQALLKAKDQHSHENPDNEEGSIDSIEPLIGLNAALKTLDILGQILKNYPGAIQAAEKERIGTACYLLGLRALNGILSIFREDGEALVAAIIHALHERDEQQRSDEQLEKKVRNVIYGLLELVTAVFLQRVAGAVGSEWLDRTYTKISKANPSPAVRLIEIMARLGLHKSIPEEHIETLYKNVKGNLFAREILRKIVWHHFRLYRAPTPVLQRVCASVEVNFTTTRTLPQPRR